MTTNLLGSVKRWLAKITDTLADTSGEAVARVQSLTLSAFGASVTVVPKPAPPPPSPPAACPHCGR